MRAKRHVSAPRAANRLNWIASCPRNCDLPLPETIRGAMLASERRESGGCRLNCHNEIDMGGSDANRFERNSYSCDRYI